MTPRPSRPRLQARTGEQHAQQVEAARKRVKAELKAAASQKQFNPHSDKPSGIFEYGKELTEAEVEMAKAFGFM